MLVLQWRWGGLALCALALPLLSAAQGSRPAAGIYSCVDAQGRRLTSDRPIPACVNREQRVLNSDIVMQFDECTPYETGGKLTTEREARASMELSLRWARRSKAEFDRLANPNALFGIVQGGMFEPLREESLAALAELDLPGYAIGGGSGSSHPAPAEARVAPEAERAVGVIVTA